MTTEQLRPRIPPLTQLMLACVVLAAVIAMSPNVADADLWGHVQYGRDAIREGLHRTTTYSFTADQHAWINHENLAELTLAEIADRFGPTGLLLAKGLAALALMLLVMRNSLRAGAGFVVTSATALLLAVNMAYHWSIRPQLFSYLCYALMLTLFSSAFAGWEGGWRLDAWWRHPPTADLITFGPRLPTRRLGWLLWLGPLFVVWTNAHGGFAAGVCIALAYLGCRGLELAVTFRRAASKPLLWIVATAGLIVAATFVNPYGSDLHVWLLKSLGQARPEITEWHPPDLFHAMAVPLWLLLATLVGSVALTRRSRDFTHLVVFVLGLWQALEHQRHIPFLAIAFAFWSPRHLQSIWSGWTESATKQDEEPAPVMNRVLAAGFLVALVLLGVRLYARNERPARSPQRLPRLGDRVHEATAAAWQSGGHLQLGSIRHRGVQRRSDSIYAAADDASRVRWSISYVLSARGCGYALRFHSRRLRRGSSITRRAVAAVSGGPRADLSR